MLDFDDPWWLIAVVLLAMLWVACAIMPVRLVSPQVSVARQYVEMDDDTSADLPPPPKPPSLFLPVVVFLLSLGLVALSVNKRLSEPEGGTRWTWMAAAAGVSSLWATVLILLTMRIR
ncbi:MAG: hypothetical protein ABFE08_16545 [Armatimonadia bacterium]